MTERTEIVSAKQMADFARQHARSERHLRRGLRWEQQPTLADRIRKCLGRDPVASVTAILPDADEARSTARADDAEVLAHLESEFDVAMVSRDPDAIALAAHRLGEARGAIQAREEKRRAGHASGAARAPDVEMRRVEWQAEADGIWQRRPGLSVATVAEILASRRMDDEGNPLRGCGFENIRKAISKSR